MGAVLLFALASAPSLAQGRRDAPEDRDHPVPPTGALNRYILDVMETYPTDGTHAYYWPEGSGRGGPPEGIDAPPDWAGTTRDLVYDGTTIAPGDPRGRCYCSGITFEVFFRAWQAWCEAQRIPFRIGDLDAAGVRRLRVLWYGADGDRRTILHALETTGLGARVPPEEARPGDFVQLWRFSGSGHSCIFLAWEMEGRSPRALRYWSSQGSTHGIGVRTEPIGPGGIDPDEFYIIRVGQ